MRAESSPTTQKLSPVFALKNSFAILHGLGASRGWAGRYSVRFDGVKPAFEAS